jgi:excisionase family DNA binding protein
MEAPNALVLIPEARLRALLEEAGEKVARRVLKGATDAAAATRPDKGWLTNSEACKYLGLSKPTLARYRASGKLPYSKVGSSVYYRRGDVEALIERGHHAAT